MDAHADIPESGRREYDALLGLLGAYSLPGDLMARDVAARLARAALEPGHLWRAMKLDDRAELRALFDTHFPELAAGNTREMRWKKYLYKKLCGWPGFEG